MRNVTGILNQLHLSNNSTLGYDSSINMQGQPLNPSINFSSAYAFSSIEDLGAYHEDKFNSVRYTRDSSLIVRQLERYFTALHNDKPTLLFNSGMGAISACFHANIMQDTEIVTVGSFYRKSLSIIERFMRMFRVKYSNYEQIEDIPFSADSNCLVLLESPSNPFLRLVSPVAVRAKLPNAKIILDITFQGLLNTADEYAEVDYIVGSCTKYIGGHNDILAGYLCVSDDSNFDAVWNERSMCGGIVDNMSAYLLLRSLRTYDLRMSKTLENVEMALGFLDGHESIKALYYPGKFSNDDQREVAKATVRHGGGVVTFEVAPSVDLKSNLAHLRSTKMAPSFGSVDSLIEIPAYMSHWGKTAEQLGALGLNEHVVRMSIGNEPWEFIENDFKILLGEVS